MELMEAKNVYIDLVLKDVDACKKITVALYKQQTCMDALDCIKAECVILKEQSLKAQEKLRRMTSLCSNLKQGNIKSKGDEDNENEQNRRAQIRNLFDVQLKEISLRIEQSTARKAAYMDEKIKLNTNLQIVLDTFSAVEKESEAHETSGLEVDLLHVDEAMAMMQELQQMELEDYTNKVLLSVNKQLKLRQLIVDKGETFTVLQQQLVDNNGVFEDYRKRINNATEMVKQIKTAKSTCSLALKPLKTDIKLLATRYAECMNELEKEKTKKEKLIKLVQALEEDVLAKETTVEQ